MWPLFFLFLLSLPVCTGWTSFPTTSSTPWCERVSNPPWPFSYSKGVGQQQSTTTSTTYWELSGRDTLSTVHLGHTCTSRGVRSKCHICRPFPCGSNPASGGETCQLQLQGVEWSTLPINVPTVTDVPFAVGPGIRHRYDYGASSRVCLFTTGGVCLRGDAPTGDYSGCTLQCWGSNATQPPVPSAFPASGNSAGAGLQWSYGSSTLGPTTQGNLRVLAGGGGGSGSSGSVGSMGGVSGWADGHSTSALFHTPTGLAVDAARNIYVADTGNHLIRVVSPTLGSPSAGGGYTVTTLAGSPGVEGFVDGAALGGRSVGGSLFSYPRGVAVVPLCGPLYGWVSSGTGGGGGGGSGCPLVVFVVDTGNHRVRGIGGVVVVPGTFTSSPSFPKGNTTASTSSASGGVWTIAGGGSAGAVWRGGDLETPPFGFRDDTGTGALFDTPTGIAVDGNGNIFVADTGNHAVRWVSAVTGRVVTLAGGVSVAALNDPPPGCLTPPCWRGVAGFVDGPTLGKARFTSPTGIAILPAPNSPSPTTTASMLMGGGDPTTTTTPVFGYSILVSEGNRVRMIYAPTTTTGGTLPLINASDPIAALAAALATTAASTTNGSALGPGGEFITAWGNAGRWGRVPVGWAGGAYDAASASFNLLPPTADATHIASLTQVLTLGGGLSPGGEDGIAIPGVSNPTTSTAAAAAGVGGATLSSIRMDTPRSLAVSLEGVVYVADGGRCKVRALQPLASQATPITCSTTPSQLLSVRGCGENSPSLDALGRALSQWVDALGHVSLPTASAYLAAAAAAVANGNIQSTSNITAPPTSLLDAATLLLSPLFSPPTAIGTPPIPPTAAAHAAALTLSLSRVLTLQGTLTNPGCTAVPPPGQGLSSTGMPTLRGVSPATWVAPTFPTLTTISSSSSSSTTTATYPMPSGGRAGVYPFFSPQGGFGSEIGTVHYVRCPALCNAQYGVQEGVLGGVLVNTSSTTTSTSGGSAGGVPMPPPLSAATGASQGYFYSLSTALCATAVHAGVVDDSVGGVFGYVVTGVGVGGGSWGGAGSFLEGVPGVPFPSPVFTSPSWVNRTSTTVYGPLGNTIQILPMPHPASLSMRSVAGGVTAPLDPPCAPLPTQRGLSNTAAARGGGGGGGGGGGNASTSVALSSLFTLATKGGRRGEVSLFPPLLPSPPFSSLAGIALFINTSLGPTPTEFLFLSDPASHTLFTLTAPCARPCENGGACTALDTCTCRPGWGGPQCTLPQCTSPCPTRSICTGPNTCSCIPGYTNTGGAGNATGTGAGGSAANAGSDSVCSTPQCAQSCGPHGDCTAPDTCSCAPGWFDANCTTPVCPFTCGNGGNCSAPQTCTCPSSWGGFDCRTPLCPALVCGNGGACVAPNTCSCAPGWAGHDCTQPICRQGFFRSSPTPNDIKYWDGASPLPSALPPSPTFVPCGSLTSPAMGYPGQALSRVWLSARLMGINTSTTPSSAVISATAKAEWGALYAPSTPFAPSPWCAVVGDPVCLATQRAVVGLDFTPLPAINGLFPTDPQVVMVAVESTTGSSGGGGSATKSAAGVIPAGKCFVMELSPSGPVPLYSLEYAEGGGTPYGGALPPFPPPPYTYPSASSPPSSSFPSPPYNVSLAGIAGVTPPALITPLTPYTWGPTPGSHPWSAPSPAPPDRQLAWVAYASVTPGHWECANGGNCTGPDTCSCAPGWAGFDCRTPVCIQGWWYPGRVDYRPPVAGQGTYAGTARTLTLWENPPTPSGKFPGYLHSHPNFPGRQGLEDVARGGFAPTHTYQPFSGGATLDHTYEGWRLNGTFNKVGGAVWDGVGVVPGAQRSTYSRACPGDPTGAKTASWAAAAGGGGGVLDTLTAFYPTGTASPWGWVGGGVVANWWSDAGGECIDAVALGCFNGGTCTAPNTCACAPGWEGVDCSLPICVSGGANGVVVPIYTANLSTALGIDAALTASAALLAGNNPDPIAQSISLASTLAETASLYALTQAFPPTLLPGRGVSAVTGMATNSNNSGEGGPGTWSVAPSLVNAPGVQQALALLSLPTWALRGDAALGTPTNPGDTYPVYRACANGGNCTRPGVCTCEKGWGGVDCATPLCAQVCLNGGVCTAPDTCTCPTHPSKFVDGRGVPRFQTPSGAPQSTGWTGFDCGVPICTQGVWVPLEVGVFDASGWGGENKDGGGAGGAPLNASSTPPVTLLPGRGGNGGVGGSSLLLTNAGPFWQGGCTPYAILAAQARARGLPPPSLTSLTATADLAAAIAALPPYLAPFISKGVRVGDSLCSQPQWWQGRYGQSWANGDPYYDPKLGISPSNTSRWSKGRTLRVNYPGFLPPVSSTTTAGSSTSSSTSSSSNGGYGAWSQGVIVPGEGMYACANRGACVAPDSCLCDVGWGGFDCTVPVCSFANTSSGTLFDTTVAGGISSSSSSSSSTSLTGCYNGGVCSGPNTCTCPSVPSLLPTIYPMDVAPGVMTGYASSTVPGGWAWVGLTQPFPFQPTGYASATTSSSGSGSGSSATASSDPTTASPYPFSNLGSMAGVYTTDPPTTTPPTRGGVGGVGGGGTHLQASDCSMPICTQGWYNASGCRRDTTTSSSSSSSITSTAATTTTSTTYGCFLCANGGSCTGPDTCTCAPGWSGYDCRTPVCTLVITRAISAAVNTRDPGILNALAQDPCGNGGQGWGACVRPGVCACNCTRRSPRDAGGAVTQPPYSGLTLFYRPPNTLPGTSECLVGYEGARNPDGTFSSCHLAILVPTWLEENLIFLVAYVVGGVVGAAILVAVLRDYLRRRGLAAKLRRRRRHGGKGASTESGTGTTTNTGAGTGEGGSTTAATNTVDGAGAGAGGGGGTEGSVPTGGDGGGGEDPAAPPITTAVTEDRGRTTTHA